MPEPDPKIQELEDRLDRLVRTQIDFQKEISLIRGELIRLRAIRQPDQTARVRGSLYTPTERPKPSPPKEAVRPDQRPADDTGPRYSSPPRMEFEDDPILSSATVSGDPFSRFFSSYSENARADLEKFIGENLISKIGILILVLGVGIGSKYAIDNNLISPLARIIVGYIFGFGLVGLAIKLKPKYHNFSAVLISGGMAIMYFVTYFAYSAYQLIAQLPAFSLMVMFTTFTVAAALIYGRQVIAHVGLVGAYAVPFLLSSDSGNYVALFGYMAVVNTGILAISIKRVWKPLFYTSSVFTWAIFYSWFVTKYVAEQHFNLALIFLVVFFAIFYATKLAQKALRLETGERETKENLIGALATGFVFYAFCFAISDAALEPIRYWTILAYLAAASIVLLATSFKTYGRAFMYLVVTFVWLIYGGWHLNRYDPSQHFYIAAVFAGLFFAIFYFSILFHRLAKDNFTLIEHTSLVLSNSFVFYGFGYSILDGDEVLRDYLGLYTAANAGLHLAVSNLVSRLRPQAIDVVQILTILVLTFTSISIPVQFDGNFVTLIWSTEAAILFWFGRKYTVRLFEYFAYPVMVLATASLFMDWGVIYWDRVSGVAPLPPIANGDFVTALVFVGALSLIYLVNRDEEFEPAIDQDLVRPFGLIIATIAIFALYNAFRIEIGNYYSGQVIALREVGERAAYAAIHDLGRFNILWQLNYTLGFLTALLIANLRRVRSALLGIVGAGLGVISLAAMSTVGMYLFYELRESFIRGPAGDYDLPGSMNLAIRYISYAFAAALLYAFHATSRDELLTKWLSRQTQRLTFEAIVYTFVFIALSCELVNLMAQFRIGDATKLGLSILWGAYALSLIVIGIARE